MRSSPGEFLTRPPALIALCLLVVNDQIAKPWLASFGGAPWLHLLIGKLSDFSGLFLLVWVLLAAWEFGQSLRGAWRGPSSRALYTAAALAALFFVALQLSPTVGQIWAWALGVVQWPLVAMGKLWRGQSPTRPGPVLHTADPSDLWAISVIGLNLWFGARRLESRAPMEHH